MFFSTAELSELGISLDNRISQLQSRPWYHDDDRLKLINHLELLRERIKEALHAHPDGVKA